MDYLYHLATSSDFWTGIVVAILVITISLLVLASLANDDHLTEPKDQAQFDADVARERARLERLGLYHGPTAPSIYPAAERRAYRGRRDIPASDPDGFAQHREVLP